jgi:hypothetical protein
VAERSAAKSARGASKWAKRPATRGGARLVRTNLGTFLGRVPAAEFVAMDTPGSLDTRVPAVNVVNAANLARAPISETASVQVCRNIGNICSFLRNPAFGS